MTHDQLAWSNARRCAARGSRSWLRILVALAVLGFHPTTVVAVNETSGGDGRFVERSSQNQGGSAGSSSGGVGQSAVPVKPDSAKPASDDQPHAPKSLDDLLGVPQDKPSAAEPTPDAALDEQARRLKKSLEEASMDDLVARAIEGMKSASERLSSAKDAGIGTQRIQEDVVRTLDRLLEEAERQQKQRSSSRSSSRSQGSGQSEGDPQEQNGQQRGAPRSARGNQDSQGAAQSAGETAAEREREDAAGSPGELDEARIEWGRLPERVRELVLQGRRDRVSSMYERLTREYYRRLAEEASK